MRHVCRQSIYQKQHSTVEEIPIKALNVSMVQQNEPKEN